MDIKALVKENIELKEENALLKQKLEKYMNQHGRLKRRKIVYF